MKTINNYLETPYRFNIIPDTNEGGYVAYFPDLPGCITCVDSINEIETQLKDAKKVWIEAELNAGRSIPEPTYDGNFSGQFKLRLPKSLHRELSDQAKEEGVSMNQLCVYLLTKNLALHKAK